MTQLIDASARADDDRPGGSGLPAPAGSSNLPMLPPQPEERLQKRLRIAGYAGGALFLMFLLAATLVQISGAVVASGALGVTSQVKILTHPTGGVLSELLVRSGARVTAGQVLMRLDTNVTETGAALTGATTDELRARRARLEAERDGAGSIRFPDALRSSSSPSASQAMVREQRLFQLRRNEQATQVALLREREVQLLAEIDSYQVQIAATREQERLIAPELEGLRTMYERKLVTLNRLNQLERTAVSLEGTAASLEANIAQARARIAEIRQQLFSVERSARSEAGTELANVINAVNDAEVRSVSARDTLDRSAIRAPQAGIVDKIAYSTPGSFVPPGQAIMEIVPVGDELQVEARVSPADIDQLRVGQPTRIMLSAFNAQTTPEFPGRLTFVSPERSVDERTGESFYRVRVSIDQAAVQREGLTLSPGMPAELFITTGNRSLLSYLLKPLMDQIGRAFRDG